MYNYNEMTADSRQQTADSRQRVLYVDFLKVIAAFGVITIHVGATGWYVQPDYSWNWQIMNMWQGIFRWPVPLFVMISGMFNIKNYDIDQPVKTGIIKVLKKIFHIYCALIFWTIFYNIFIPIISGHNIKEFFANPSGFLNIRKIITYPYKAIDGNSWFHLWFLYMIIGLYILTPVIKIFVSNCKKIYLEYLLLVFFIFGAGVPFYNFVNSLKGIPLLPSKINISLPELSGYVGYYIAGYYFANYKMPKKAEYILYALGVLSAVFTIWGTSFISVKTNNLNQTLLLPITPHIMLETFAVFVFFKNIFHKIALPVFFNKIITNMGKCSFGIYLIHVFMITFVNSFFGICWYTFNPIISVPIICVLVFLLSYLVTFIISKVPILKRYVI
ncbi:MAG: acyltransferase family protein [Treponemataceae bacterium]|nr:MAG: acyltransferase family protein [Treponemataceae bacterium]